MGRRTAVALLISATLVLTPMLTACINEASGSPNAWARGMCARSPALRDPVAAEPAVSIEHPAPPISAASAAVIDAATGRVLYGHHMNERRAPASTTKIMTAMLSLESITDENTLVWSATDASRMRGSSVMGLWPAAPVTMRDLLYGLMLPSGNDAALELARNLAPSVPEFVDRMNERVRQMGLHNTQFANPHGLDNRAHYSSAYDMAVMARAAMQNPRFREIATTDAHHLAPPFDYDIFNGNSLLDIYPGATGVKIGFTGRAGWTFVASAQRDGREVIVSLMRSDNRDADAAALLDWAFAGQYWNGGKWAPPPAPRTQRGVTICA